MTMYVDSVVVTGPRPDREAGVHAALPVSLVADWSMTVTPADAAATPADLPSSAVWCRAAVPGTALDAWWDPHSRQTGFPPPLHDHDVWYQTVVRIQFGEQLRFLGLAGLAEIWIGGDRLACSTNMFVAHTVAVPCAGDVVLAMRFRALNPALGSASGRSRWRTKLVTSNGLRAQRQTLLGHMPGWCPPFHAVGPYRAIERVQGRGTITSCQLSAELRGEDGVLHARIAFAAGTGRMDGLRIQLGRHVATLRPDAPDSLTAELLLPAIEPWWPHTHGMPRLHDVMLVDGPTELHLGRVGFRKLAVLHGNDGAGFGLEINDVPVFCRGACWTSADLLGLRHDRDTYAAWLRLARDAGMNMIRIGGTMLYESRSFHELCDELGILVWQDLMFANLDYATGQADFRDSAILEVEQLLERLSGSPSLAVLCGGSEMAQQATFLGLDAGRRAMEFFETFLPRLVSRLSPDLSYVPHSPWGGALPVAVSAGVAHYYGVGAYRRPLEDARRAAVRFASECVALANPPSATSPAVTSIEAGPRDRGASWTFADVRDHYLRELYSVDPASLRGEDPVRYHDLSRAVTADLMEAVFGEWRRPGSSCRGGLVWQLQDLAPGSGWGVIDSYAHPKAAWHGLCRVLAPIQILLSDEGVDGLGLHVLNETARPLEAIVRLACLGRGSVTVASGEQRVRLQARGSLSISSQSLLDGFFDVSRAYRFGPAEHSITIATLRCAATGDILSEAFHFPQGRALPPDDLGLTAVPLRQDADWCLDITAMRFAQAVHVQADGCRAERDWFHLQPGVTRRVRLLPETGTALPPRGIVDALNSLQPASIGNHR